jgi:glycine/D-amino acid oxidase-like deaminating enzyme
MRRVFSDYAYGPGPRDSCWWDETQFIPAFPTLCGDVSCDVAIIGAGFTGVSAALHLAQGGASVVLLDANQVGWGASGRNGGFCCLGGSMASDAALDRRYGRSARLEWRQAEMAAVSLVDQLLADMVLAVDQHSVGETCLAHRPRDFEEFDARIAAAQENYGVTPQIIERNALDSHGMAGPFFGAITTPVGFGLNPRKYLAGLVDAACAAGVQVFEQSPVNEIGKAIAKTPQGTVRADRIVLATNGYSSEDVPAGMAGRYMPAQSTVLVTRPMSRAELAAQGWTTTQMGYDTRTLLHYFRLMPDNRFLFGMRGGLIASGAAERRARAKVLCDFRRIFPAWSHVNATHSWSGMVCLSRDMVPFVGELDNVLVGFAFHGNGIAMGTFTGRLLADLALGKVPELYPEVMRTPARPFPLGRMRRLVMPLIYAAFRLGDLGR